MAAADVVDGVGRDGKAVLARLLGGGFLHHAVDAFDDVIHISEVPAAIAVVVYLYRLALQELVRKAEVGHVRAAGRAVDRKEPQACSGYVIQLAIAMGKQLVALLGGCIQANRIVHPVFHAERNLLVATINA